MTDREKEVERLRIRIDEWKSSIENMKKKIEKYQEYIIAAEQRIHDDFEDIKQFR